LDEEFARSFTRLIHPKSHAVFLAGPKAIVLLLALLPPDPVFIPTAAFPEVRYLSDGGFSKPTLMGLTPAARMRFGAIRRER
jgi:hypothetical protein